MREKMAIRLTAAAAMTLGMTMTAFAWDTSLYLYEPTVNEQGYVTGWTWQDPDCDGVFECYYSGDGGVLQRNTTTPDGYVVNEKGQWVVDGVVQVKNRPIESKGEISSETVEINGVRHTVGYDPAHPLANVIDVWNLRLPSEKMGEIQVVDNNVQAMLTGQMEEYFAAPVGEYTDEAGNSVYTTQEDYDEARRREQVFYQWFCDWLNGMDFEHMTEMERAREIQKVVGQAEYVYGTSGIGYYGILIEKKGQCSDFGMTACALAKALGLRSGISGYGNHTVYYIWVDGEQYMGENYGINLEYPSNLDHQGDWTNPRW